jgi:GDPmannose 4,6-dehydratase
VKALICGASGQDGAYLAQLLLGRGYEVYGTSRDASSANFTNLEKLGLRQRVQMVSMSVNDFRSVIQVLQKVQPNEIYNLAGQSSVGLSFEQPVETFESICVATINLLEAIRFTQRNIRFYNAGSGECYGNTGDTPADEETLFRPSSPYAVAKSAAYWAVANYRQSYNLHACTGILFNHESPLRPARFVTRKIVAAACRIAGGSKEKLRLGNIDIVRDWGWAPEYVEAMWLMLQQPLAEDFLIATGHSYSLREFVATAFSELGLDWEKFVEVDASLLRPSDHAKARANPAKALGKIGWKAQRTMPEVVRQMLMAERMP